MQNLRVEHKFSAQIVAFAEANLDLFKKYGISGPRYTSYPSVPYWKDVPSEQDWKDAVLRAFQKTNRSEGISLYLHLPFCESLCTFCGCNKIITKNHDVEDPYVSAISKEWKLYRDLFPEAPSLKEMHLGGGTPTFFSTSSLLKILEPIVSSCSLRPDTDMSFEAHPNVTSEEQVRELGKLGFNRVSFGIQDFDPRVQTAVNRVQSYETVKGVTDAARKFGYKSVNFDLIYGLPHQTVDSVKVTLAKVLDLRPDRIAFYSYAHVPWIKPSQRRYSDEDLPVAEEKRKLYDLGREAFLKAGYIEIGMDHFALPHDSLSEAVRTESVYRNFMGYTTKQTTVLLGLGISSIGDTWDTFGQNTKNIEEYYEKIDHGKLPLVHGHKLSAFDTTLRREILNLMCYKKTKWSEEMKALPEFETMMGRLAELQADGLIQYDNTGVKVTNIGLPFLRNVCMALDEYYWRAQTGKPLFSSTI